MASPRVFINESAPLPSLSVAIGVTYGSLTVPEAEELILRLRKGINLLTSGDDAAPAEPDSSDDAGTADTAVTQNPAQLQHVATVLNSLRPKLDQLPALAMRWHEANLRLRLQHAGRQFDQRTIAKEAALAEHRHGTAYFRAGEEVGLGRYSGGHFYYNGERYVIVPLEMRTMRDRQPEAVPVARRMF